MTVYTWRYRGDLGENKDRLHVGTGESDVGTGLINDKATLGEMEDLCNQSCISPLCEGGGTQTDARDSHPFIASNVFGVGKKKFNLIICQYRFYVSPAIHLSQKILGQHLMTLMTLQVLRHSHLLLTSYIQCLHMVDRAETHASMEEDDCDEKSYLRKMRKRMRGTIFGGQEPDYWKADEDVDLETANEDPNEPDVPDPYDAVYANVPNETHMLKPEDNCEHCNAKKFESEPPGFCCHSGKIHLSTPETPPELVRLWSSSNANARHFCANIRYFNGHFSFTSLYCKLDRVTTDMKNCGIYTFRAHNQIYHNIRSFGKEDGHEPRHLELYFYDDDPSLEHRLRKCREKSAQEDREVIQRLKDILHGINPYSENIRSIGQVDNLKDYHVELNLDQRLDQRTYNVPLTSEMRPGIFNPILYDKRLFQQFAIDTYVKIESSRLNYIRNNQDLLKADLYQGLVDNWRTRVEDADEDEIKNELYPGQSPQDHPDLVTRVFRAKLEKLKRMLMEKDILGKITCPEQYDLLISAELPNKKKYPDLYKMPAKVKEFIDRVINIALHDIAIPLSEYHLENSVIQIVLENYQNKSSFAGLEHFKLLASSDPEIVVAALEILAALDGAARRKV
ncbi:uncharacterized protein LOC101768973 [Setaria italica]|uniref:uncharacterized protein LOC101768973 n=1 Tax=Setaria italica TaxID=4555 RepID=UPI000BE54CC1|nr:uncharacterized protein LOC101768973 [Setaria italica]